MKLTTKGPKISLNKNLSAKLKDFKFLRLKKSQLIPPSSTFYKSAKKINSKK